MKYLRHVKFKTPLTVRIDGKLNKAAIFKEGIQLAIESESLEEDIIDLPPDGFM